MMSHNHRNFWIANTVNALFFSGYLILKFPLAFILAHEGLPLNSAYSLTTTSTIVFALCSLLLTQILKDYRDQKHIFLLGIILNLIAIIQLETGHYYFIISGLSCYVLGGSLYFFNITLLFNKQFQTPRERLHGNYIAQICLNIGALVGIIIFLFFVASDHYYFFSSIVFISTALLILLLCYPFFKDNSATKKQRYRLYGNCILMLLLIALCLQFNSLTRWLVLCAFIVGIVLALYRSWQNNEGGGKYFLFIILVLLFSLPFWIANTVLYNQFFVFLHDNVLSFLGIPATAVILFDPLGNIVFGLLWIRMMRNKNEKPYINLQLGLLFIAAAFGILSFAVHMHSDKILVYFPIVTILLFACAQFLIQPTLHSRVNDLIANHHNMLFALGILRAIRAVAAILAYYLLNISINAIPEQSLNQNTLLYFCVMIISLLALTIFLFIKNKIIIDETVY